MEINEISYPGLTNVQSAQITIMDGVEPSIAVVTCAIPQDGTMVDPAPNGNLVLHGKDTITIPDCAINSAVANVSTAGDTVTFQIVDSRWRWNFGKPISHRGGGNSWDALDQITEALDEPISSSGFVIDAIDLHLLNTHFFDWDIFGANPKDELALWLERHPEVLIVPTYLSASYQPGEQAFKFIIKKNRAVKIDHSRVMKYGLEFESPVAHAKYRHVWPVYVYATFRLDPVARDAREFLSASGDIMPLSGVSYQPPNFWEWPNDVDNIPQNAVRHYAINENQNEADLDDQLVQRISSYAQETAFKWYRIAELAQADKTLVGSWNNRDFHVSSFKNFLPLAGPNPSGAGQGLVYGDSGAEGWTPRMLVDVWRSKVPGWEGNTIDTVVNGSYILGDDFTLPAGASAGAGGDTFGPVPNGFTLDCDTGIVKFEEPVVSSRTWGGGVGDSRYLYPAALYLSTLAQVHDSDGNLMTYQVDTPDSLANPNGTGFKIVTHDLHALVYHHWQMPPAVSEHVDMQDLFNGIVGPNWDHRNARHGWFLGGIPWDEGEVPSKMKPKDSATYDGSVTYAGLVKVELDGYVRQVSYVMGPGGSRTMLFRSSQEGWGVKSPAESARQSRLKRHENRLAQQRRDGTYLGKGKQITIQR